MKNPVLKGFNPDPSALVYNDRVYVAVSTFQWVPGVTIYETKDLVNYQIISTPLKHLDLRGNPIDTSIWAPQLSYADGLFYLLYTEVKITQRPFKDLHNYLVTSSSIQGPWSKPIYLNSSGFDPSLFHEDQKSFMLQEIWDYRKKEDNKFAGIIMQEYDRKNKKLVGKIVKLFEGTEAKKTEGPHLYHIGDYYYLITAEGGTKETHQVTIARSKQMFGPYELDPKNPMLTSKNNIHNPLQCAGHASLIDYKGQYYMYHLATRGYPSILGRETALQAVFLNDQLWFELQSGNEPCLDLDLPDLIASSVFEQDFKTPLDDQFLFLRRMPTKKWLRPVKDGLKVYGGDSLSSTFDLSLLGIRLQDFNFETTLTMSYKPKHYNEMAGIGLYLDESKHLYFYITDDEVLGKVARLYKKNILEYQVFDEVVPINDQLIQLTIKVNDGVASFMVNHYTFETTINVNFLVYNFTGTAIIASVSDLNKRYQSYAIFKSLKYQPLP